MHALRLRAIHAVFNRSTYLHLLYFQRGTKIAERFGQQELRIMKRWLSIAGLASALFATACGGDCEYVSTVETARVSVTAMPQEVSYCYNDPVEITLTWGNENKWVLSWTTDTHLSQACAKSLGLVDGAGVRIKATVPTGDVHSYAGIAPCQETDVTLIDIDISVCVNECVPPPTCPSAAPPPGEFCRGSLSCHYGPEVKCPPEAGTTDFWDCVDGVWVANQKQNCDVCGVSCEPPPPCIHCGEVVDVKPPDQINFCTTASADLYQAFWNCSCVAGNVCEPVCNAAPSGGIAFCAGGAPSTECMMCVQSVSPSGCSEALNACMSDFP